MDKCKLWWCEAKRYAKGYCYKHYRATIRFGSPYGMHRDIFTKIDDIVDKSRGVAKIILGQEGLFGPDCQFCGRTWPNHKADCIVNIANQIIIATNETKSPD